ncbi:DnaB-like helicase C-terminal domain-containing protein [Algoriphagus formosus]|uniref:DnaB-like helicase C-terminal domain-containing protein n=1 Tax=Algoriphagus formosus TaxID=2007308 RepID=UPI0012FE5902|nr:DnaB-like helicase C-terminal domain-containing protein [Algoriphagus formosus]
MNKEEFLKRLGIEGSLTQSLLSGFKDLDVLVNGGFSNEIVTIASRPAHGKTSLLFNLMMNFSIRQEFKGIVAFTRMTQRDFIFYFSSWITNTDFFKAEPTEETLEKIYPHYNLLTSKRVKVVHQILSLDEIFTLAELHNADYILLDDYFRSYTWEYDVKKYAEDFSKIQDFVQKKKISVFVTILTSRMAEKRGGDMSPRLCDVYRSDLVSTYSHKVIQLYRPEVYGITMCEDGYTSLGLMEMLIQQNSKGRTGSTRFFHLAPRRMLEDPGGAFRTKLEGAPSRSSIFPDFI